MDEAAEKHKRRRRMGILAGTAAAALVVAGPLVTLAVRPADAVAPPAALTQPNTKPVTSNSIAPSADSPDSATPSPTATTPTPSSGGSTSSGRGSGGSAVSAQVTASPRDWGTNVDLELRGIVGPMVCQLFAVSRTGDTRVVTGWAVPAKGYGIPGSPDPLRLTGSTSMAIGDILKFEVRTDDGTVLVTILR